SMERQWLRSAVVLIGGTYAGANDQLRGIGGSYYNGVEIHAHALATLLDGRPLRRGTQAQEAMITGAVGLLVAGVVVFLPFGWISPLGVLVGGLWWGLSLRAFAADALLPMAGPFLAIGLAWAGHHTGRSVEEARRRRWIQGVFGRYISTEIVTDLLRHPEHLDLGGVEREVSVLFLDIRGYTRFAHGRSPTAVMEALNAFFGVVAPVIDRCQGLILEYTGDGLLAVFGAPTPLPHHAQAAVAAAIGIVQASRHSLGSASELGPDRSSFRVGCGV